MHSSLLIGVLSLGSLIPKTIAAPFNTLQKRAPGTLLDIAPKGTTCSDAKYAAECKTNVEAAGFINQAFQTYKITSPAEAAAIVSTMAFETDDFKYNINHFPGIAGQGTRNMQSPKYNLEYAQSIPALKDKLAAAGTDPKAVLALLTADGNLDFGSAAWFLTTQCSADVRTALQAGTKEGWKSYITKCVLTTVTPQREAIWNRAMMAFGVSPK